MLDWWLEDVCMFEDFCHFSLCALGLTLYFPTSHVFRRLSFVDIRIAISGRPVIPPYDL